jgi:hypothetical protein
MIHVHWWLFGLAFLAGLALTLMLIVRPLKRRTGAKVTQTQPEGPTTHMTATENLFTATISADDAFPTAKTPAEGEFAKASVERDASTTGVPTENDSPTAKTSRLARLLRKRAPQPAESPTRKAPIAKAASARKVAPGKGAPVRKAPTGKAAPAKKAPPAKLWPEKKAPAAGSLPAKKTPRAKVSPTKRTRQLPYEPFGPGSARATPEGGGPAGWPVKGRTDTRLYYTPDDPMYDLTVAQVWFRDEQSAARALFTPWRKSSQNH